MTKVHIWKNVEELEESITIDELQALLEEVREQEKQERIFLAGLKGIDLTKDEPVEGNKFDEIKRRAQAKLNGVSADEQAKLDEASEFRELGIAFVTD